MNTTEERKGYLAHSDNEMLVDTFARFAKHASDPFKFADRFGVSVEVILEDYELAKAELLLRLNAIN